MKKIWIVTRHAHRDTADQSADNGLSEKGKKQAQALKDWLLERLEAHSEENPFLATSPKTRCRESLAPLEEALGISSQVIIGLDEQLESEDSRAFISRIRATLTELKNRKESTVILSSHADWIPFALEFLTDEQIHLGKGEALELHWKSREKKFQAGPFFRR